MYVRPSAPLSIGGVVDDAIRLYSSSLKYTWKMSLVFAVVIAVIGLAVGLTYPETVQIPSGGGMVALQQWVRLAQSPVATGSNVIVSIIDIVFYGALLASQNAVVKGEPLSGGQAASASMHRFVSLLIAAVVFIIAMVIGCLALLIPGIYLWGKLQLWPAAVFAEDAGPMEALGSSWKLTKGRWWRTMTIVTVCLLLLYILALAVGLLPGVLLGISLRGATFDTANLLTAQLAMLPFGIISGVLITPAMPAVLLAVYHDCKLRSEGGDLAERAGALGRA